MALENELDLVNGAVLLAELVVGTNVLPNETKRPDRNFDSDLLKTFTPQGVLERLARVLASAGEGEPLSCTVTMLDRKQKAVFDDDCLRGVADRCDHFERSGMPNGLEMSRPASSRILLDEPTPQLAGSAPSSC